MRSVAAIQARLESQQVQLESLLHAEAGGNDPVHRCRVLIKKLRAWIRLVRPARKVSGSKAADRKLQALGRELGTTRDQQVLKDTLQSLAAGTTDPKAKSACRKLRRKLNAQAGADAALSPTTHPLDQLCLPNAKELDHAALREGLRANYSKTRKLSRIALADVSDMETLHRFRRWVKYLHYQLALLYPLKKSTLEQPALMKELGTTLGQMHDLHVLLVSLQEGIATEDESAQLVAPLAEQRVSQLTQDFIAKTGAVFAAKPKEFMPLL
jgi:CHAD domain-containing protein